MYPGKWWQRLSDDRLLSTSDGVLTVNITSTCMLDDEKHTVQVSNFESTAGCRPWCLAISSHTLQTRLNDICWLMPINIPPWHMQSSIFQSQLHRVSQNLIRPTILPCFKCSQLPAALTVDQLYPSASRATHYKPLVYQSIVNEFRPSKVDL